MEVTSRRNQREKGEELSSYCKIGNADVIGGAEGARTPGLRIANAALCQTELLPHAESILGSGGESCQGSDTLIAPTREPLQPQII